VTGYFGAAPRSLQPGDSEAVRSLVFGVLGVTPYVDRAIELLSAAERGDPELRAVVIERDGTVAALAVYGPASGAPNTWQMRVFLLAPGVEPRDVGRVIIDALLEQLRHEGGRALIAELPADPVLGNSLTALRKNGFRQVARVPDFFREGVALLFLRREV
jgi:L-amino acid N-acyltransferase YncA